MPITHGKNLYFAISVISGGTLIPLTAYTQEVNGLPGEKEMGDVTVGGASGHKWFPGLQKVSFSAKMVMNTVSAGSWDTCKSFQADTAPRLFSFCPAGTTAGYPMYTGNCWIKTIDFPVSATELNKFTINCEADDGITVGVAT